MLQVDLGVPKMVRGIITQGARGLEGSSSAENRAFVRKYKLAHSLNSKDWTYITDSKTSFAKVKMVETHFSSRSGPRLFFSPGLDISMKKHTISLQPKPP